MTCRTMFQFLHVSSVTCINHLVRLEHSFRIGILQPSCSKFRHFRSNAYKLLHHRVMHEELFCCGTKFTLVFLLLAHLIMIFTKLVLLWEVHGIGTTHESSKRLPVWTCCDISHIITYTAWSIDDKTGIHRRSPWRRHYARIFEAPPNRDTL